MARIVVSKVPGKNGNGHHRKAFFANPFRSLATEISEDRYQEYLKRGDSPEVAAALADTVKLIFSRESSNDVF